MEETIMSAVNETINTAGQYIEEISAVTGISVFGVAILGIALAVVLYRITRNILSIVFTLIISFILCFIIKTVF